MDEEDVDVPASHDRIGGRRWRSRRVFLPAGMLLFIGLMGMAVYACSGKLSCFSALCYGSLMAIGLGGLVYGCMLAFTEHQSTTHTDTSNDGDEHHPTDGRDR